VAPTNYPGVVGNIGLTTMASTATGAIIYDSNPQFSYLNLYNPGNTLLPTIVRDGSTTIEDRVG